MSTPGWADAGAPSCSKHWSDPNARRGDLFPGCHPGHVKGTCHHLLVKSSKEPDPDQKKIYTDQCTKACDLTNTEITSELKCDSYSDKQKNQEKEAEEFLNKNGGACGVWTEVNPPRERPTCQEITKISSIHDGDAGSTSKPVGNGAVETCDSLNSGVSYCRVNAAGGDPIFYYKDTQNRQYETFQDAMFSHVSVASTPVTPHDTPIDETVVGGGDDNGGSSNGGNSGGGGGNGGGTNGVSGAPSPSPAAVSPMTASQPVSSFSPYNVGAQAAPSSETTSDSGVSNEATSTELSNSSANKLGGGFDSDVGGGGGHSRSSSPNSSSNISAGGYGAGGAGYAAAPGASTVSPSSAASAPSVKTASASAASAASGISGLSPFAFFKPTGKKEVDKKNAMSKALADRLAKIKAARLRFGNSHAGDMNLTSLFRSKVKGPRGAADRGLAGTQNHYPPGVWSGNEDILGHISISFSHLMQLDENGDLDNAD